MMSRSRPHWSSLGLDLVTLKVFMAVVRERNLTTAAAREGIAASAVSRRLQDLEARCGVALLTRHRDGIGVTPEGELLVRQLGTIFDLLDEVAASLDTARQGITGTVHVQAHMSAVACGLPLLLTEFMAANPGIEINLQEATSPEVMRAIESGVADLGFVSGTVPNSTLEMLPWRRDTLVVVLPSEHPLAENESLQLLDLLEESFIGMQRDSALQQLYRQHAKMIGSSLKERAFGTSFESVRTLVRAGLGVAILPASAARPAGSEQGLKAVRLNEPWSRRDLVLCRRRQSGTSAAAQRFVRHVLSYAEASEPGES